MRARRSERGSALLLSILATAVLGAGLMAVLMLSGAERRTVMNHQAQTDAYAIAESALEQFATNRTSLGFTSSPAAAYESTRVAVAGGYADVVLQRLRPRVGVTSAVYVIRSHGYATNPQLSGTPLAERQVAQLAGWSDASMRPLAAWTSIPGLTRTSGFGASGMDACGVESSVFPVAVPIPGILTPAQLAAFVTIDWNGIVNLNAVSPDVVLPGGAWPSFADPSVWPTIRVNGDYTLPGSGQGVLIVTGSLTMAAYSWKGVILVGNKLTMIGATNVQGAIVTGLNLKLGQAVAISDPGSGTKNIRYNSCNIASALAGYGGLTLHPTAWMDNWSGW